MSLISFIIIITLVVRVIRGRGLIFLVYLDLSILSAGGQHLRVSTEAHTQHRIVHHHEVILSLVLKILKDTMHANNMRSMKIDDIKYIL